MYYFLTYNKETGDVKSLSKVSSREAMTDPLNTNEENIEVVEDKYIEIVEDFDWREFRLKGKVKNDKIVNLKSEKIYQGKILLSTDAKDQDGDGKPELPADGKWSAKLFVTIVDNNDKPIKNKIVKVDFKTALGSLSKRSVETKNGLAEVELISSKDTAESRIIATSVGYRTSVMILEFIPSTEFFEKKTK